MAVAVAIAVVAVTLIVISHIAIIVVPSIAIVIGSDDATRGYQKKSDNRAVSGDALQHVHKISSIRSA
jgi:hypothetical protein